MLGSDLRPVHVQCHNFFRRKPHPERRLGTVDSRINKGIEFEFDSEFLVGEFAHADDFVLVDAGGHGFQFQRQSAIQQQTNSA